MFDFFLPFPYVYGDFNCEGADSGVESVISQKLQEIEWRTFFLMFVILL